jgi:DNA-binding NarL/FixJ family response regulator
VSQTLDVVVVDDDPDVRYLVAMLIESDGRGCVVAEADSAATGVEAARVHQPDVVFIDVSMKGRTGIRALPDLRAVAPGASVIVMSGDDHDKRQGAALAEGARAFVPKQQLQRVLPGLLDDLLAARGN